MSRWTPRAFKISDLPIRVVPGSKESGDLRIEWMTPRGWRAIHMQAMFALVDFFSENEDWLSLNRDHWRWSAYEYLQNELASAMRDGYRAPTRRIVDQRARLARQARKDVA